MIRTAGFTLLAMLVAAAPVQATTFQFAYQADAGTISGRFIGALQADLNTILIDALVGPVRFNGVAGVALPLLTTASGIYGVDRPLTATLDGSRLDFAFCTDVNCADGLVFDPDVIDVAPVIATGASLGELHEFSDPTLWNVSAVPEAATWLSMIAGFVLVGGQFRRRSIVLAA